DPAIGPMDKIGGLSGADELITGAAVDTSVILRVCEMIQPIEEAQTWGDVPDCLARRAGDVLSQRPGGGSVVGGAVQRVAVAVDKVVQAASPGDGDARAIDGIGQRPGAKRAP